APGHAAAETSLSLAEGERRVLVAGVGPELIVRTEAPRPAPPPARPAPVVPWVVLGLGAATTLVGATCGILAVVPNGQGEVECRRAPGALLCSQAGPDAARQGHTDAMIANITVPIGLVAAAAGGYLLWRSARSPEYAELRAVPVGANGAELRFGRAF